MVVVVHSRLRLPSQLLLIYAVFFSTGLKDLVSLCPDQNSSIYLSEGPTNITIIEGYRNLLIPCVIKNVVSENFYPIWEVNGTVYEMASIPSIYRPMSNGLLVLSVNKYTNNTSFRCFFPKKNDHSSNSVLLQSSPLGFLTVRINGSSNGSYMPLYRTNGPQLSIDHQVLFFDNKTKIFAWKVLQPNMECDHFIIEARRHCADPTSVIKTWRVQARNISIPASETVTTVGKMPVYFNITSRTIEGNTCQVMVSDIQINESTITKKLVVSHEPIKFMISTVYATLYIAFPVNQADTPDCLCPIIILDEDDCYNLEQCHCANEAAILNSAGLVNVCHNSSTGKLSLYIQNITKTDFNNTRLHFYNSFLCNNDSFVRIYRHYTDSFEIYQAIPEKPTVHVTFSNETYDVCITNSERGLEYIDSYEINVFDITGEIIYHMFIFEKSSENCISLPSDIRLNSKCAPFIVSVVARNLFGSSTQNVSITPLNYSIQSVCSCLNDSVQVKIVSIEANSSTSLQITTLCNNYYFSDVKLEVRLTPIYRSKIIMCSQANASVEFNQLDCTESYDVDVLWISPDKSSSSKCLLTKYNSTSYLFPQSQCPHEYNYIIYVVIPVTSIIFIVIINTVVIVLCTNKCVFCSKTRTTRTRRISRDEQLIKNRKPIANDYHVHYKSVTETHDS